MKQTFVESIEDTQKKAVDRFISEYGVSRQEWEEMTWDQWHKVPVFTEMLLYPLGGSMRFIGLDFEEVHYSFQNKRPGQLFGIIIEVDSNRRWTGSVMTSEGDVNDAARSAITGLLELAYLRATQP